MDYFGTEDDAEDVVEVGDEIVDVSRDFGLLDDIWEDQIVEEEGSGEVRCSVVHQYVACKLLVKTCNNQDGIVATLCAEQRSKDTNSY